MITVKTSWNLFKMQVSTQTDNHKLRKNVATDKMHILRKMSLKFQNPKFNILCKMAFCNKKKYPGSVKPSYFVFLIISPTSPSPLLSCWYFYPSGSYPYR